MDRLYPGRMLCRCHHGLRTPSIFSSADGDECNMAFPLPLMPRIYMAIAQENPVPDLRLLRQTPKIPENCHWAVFLLLAEP